MWPSFTGGMVSNFKSDDAVAMFDWVQESLWPYVNPQSISYEFMQEPLLSGEVMVAFDHTARLLDAFNSDPEGFRCLPGPGRSLWPWLHARHRRPGHPQDCAQSGRRRSAHRLPDHA